MSDSRKKNPGFVDSNSWAKNQANRRVRRFKGEVQDGGWYKKNYCQYNICDWANIMWTEAELADFDKWQKHWHDGPFAKSSYRYRAYMK